MPLRRRPTSPVSLEICAPPSDDDIDSDGIVGSGDELDGDAGAARRQRIEKLAEAYLQGTPLFILSASLKGPFDKGWVNPWRKIRKPEHAHSTIEESVGPVVQETEPRHRRQLYELQEQSRSTRSSVAASDFRSDNGRLSSNQQQIQQSLQDRQSRPSAPPQGTPKSRVSHAADIQLNSELRDASISRPTDANWLKRDRRRIGFQDFDPPASPTTSMSNRYSDARHRTIRTAKQQSPIPQFKSHSPPKRSERPSPGRSQATRHRDPINDQPPHSTEPTPSKRQSASKAPLSEALNSFCVVSSTSQLPKFEYRRRRKRSSDEERQSKSPSIQRAEMESFIPTDAAADAEQPYKQEPVSSNGSTKHISQHDQIQDEHPLRHTFTSTTVSHPEGRSDSRPGQSLTDSRTTHGNTTENLPSAQQVPPIPALASYAPSLQTTALPTDKSENEEDTGPNSYMSTQAALLHAQQSFRNGLESPSDEGLPTSAKKRRSSQSPLKSSKSNKITPFHQVTARPSDISNGLSKVPGTAMPSTQFMVDAVTPFTFSTDRKRHVHIGFPSESRSSHKKQKIANSVELSSPSEDMPWSSTSEERQPGNRNQQVEIKQNASQPVSSGPSGRVQEGPESMALPFTLTGSTPSTGPDGQVDIPGADSFNLSQAIADAGSWLQESFDINRDLRHISTKEFNAS